MNEPVLTNEELTAALEILRAQIETWIERVKAMEKPPRANPTLAEAQEMVEKAVKIARRYQQPVQSTSPLPSRLRQP